MISAPSAHADIVDDAIEAAFSPFLDAATDTLDWDALLTPAAWASFLDSSLHAAVEDWIHSPLGQQLDQIINTPVMALTGRDLIGDGAAGTAEHPSGGAGGWLFGDGGAGWDSTLPGSPGGDGGDAGLFGDGGSGGDGGPAGAGGDGGDGGWLLGNGGAGGDAGDAATGLPALGGAGGNAGPLGEHGAVGHYGTLASGPPTANAGLTTAGDWLVDGDGKVVVLHGLNQVYNLPPYEPSADGFGDDDAAFLAANGFNAVRLVIIWAAIEPQPGVFDNAYLDSIAQTVQTLHNHGIVSLLDMSQGLYSTTFGGQGAPEWATLTGGLPNLGGGFPFGYILNPAQNYAWDSFWTNAKAPDDVGLENHFAQMYQYVANYFKDDPGVFGYELMNEPWAGSSWLSTVFGNSFFEAQQLTPFYNQVASAIRSVDPTTPVFYQPNSLFNEAVPTSLGTVDQPHTVFSFHDYCPLDSVEFLRPLTFLCGPYLDLIADNAEAYAGAHGIGAFMTEFGSTNDLGLIADTMQVADHSRLSWLEFSYAGSDNPTSTGQPELVLDPSKPPVGDNVDAAKLQTMAVPYPQVVAGTPDSWSYDPDSGTFTFSYSTAMADGVGTFAAGQQTTVSVPSLAYPDGYQVHVTGGHAVSDPGAAVLVVASDPGATTVTVVVSSAAGGA